MDERTLLTIVEVLVEALEKEKLMRTHYEEKARDYEKQLAGEVKENA